MESEGSFYRSKIVPSCIVGRSDNNGLKGYSNISNQDEQFIRKCSVCSQDFYGLNSNYSYEYVDTLCTIFVSSENGSKSGFNFCDHCGTLLNNLVRARDVFLQCFNDLITTTGRWLPEGEKSEIIFRLLNYSCGKNTCTDQLDDVDYTRGSVDLLANVGGHEESTEQINIPELIPSIELSNASSVDNELSRESLVITIEHPVGKTIVSTDGTVKSSKPFEVGPGLEPPHRLVVVETADDEEMLGDGLPSEEQDEGVFLPSLRGTDDKHNSDDMLDPDPGGSSDTEVVKKKKTRKLYNCSICTRNCKTARELDLHMGVHLQERKFICEVCGLAYRHKKALEVHVGLHRGEAKFECEHCHKVFTQKSGLQRHLPIHTGEMAYQCDICGKRFLYNTSFNVHKFTHTKHKEFQCFECGLSFFSKSHLKRHMKTHTGVKPHICENCGKRKTRSSYSAKAFTNSIELIIFPGVGQCNSLALFLLSTNLRAIFEYSICARSRMNVAKRFHCSTLKCELTVQETAIGFPSISVRTIARQHD
ncbi:unnamed protein product [Allacma fusca]|uniref:C2H2-type domain-containing protein n=1 Tax=Allacma fusca TaxID=39272 RepID=A0A8J2JD47_9HEXA|nr:unnamed protein product [Allacma fusca]